MLEVHPAGPSASVIRVRGDVTAAAEPALMDAYTRADATNPRAVILDFAGLEYMNSGGIGLLVMLLVRANRKGQRLLAIGLDPHYRQILEITRLNEAIGVHDTEQAAVAWLAVH
jgi:anti-sigma B factor antagonist